MRKIQGTVEITISFDGNFISTSGPKAGFSAGCPHPSASKDVSQQNAVTALH